MNGRHAVLLAAMGWAMVGCSGGGGLFQPKAPSGDEQTYAILLYYSDDPTTHVQQVKKFQERIQEHTGWKDVFIVHKANRSELYWGKYARPEDAQKNLRTAREYTAPNGDTVFARAIVVALPGKDVGPPEWNLANAKGAYTVVVAIFYDVPQDNYTGRKNKAVDYCRQLREEQKLEAYYFHDPSKSAVTIGAFDRASVETIRDSKEVRMEVRNPKIQAVQRQFPLLAVNGYSERQRVPDRLTRKATFQEVKSYVASIPQKKGGDSGAESLDRVGQPQPR